MAAALDVAYFFIDIFKDSPDPMTHLRLEKFIFEAQAWNLVKTGKPLFSEEIEAWEFGPVVPSVYDAFKGYGRKQIRKTSGEYSSRVFTSEQIKLLLDVSRKMGVYSTGTLVERTHAVGSPWEQTYVKGCNKPIPLDLIKEYYSKKDTLIEFNVADAVKKLKPAGPRNKDGRTVFPNDWDD